MDSDEPCSGEKDGVRPRSKRGLRTFLSGPRLSIALSLMQKQRTQLDWLAVEIRAAHGIWITRSAIITAIIEAALRSDVVADLPAADEKARDVQPAVGGDAD